MTFAFFPLIFCLVALVLFALCITADVVRGRWSRASMARVLARTGLQPHVAWLDSVTLTGIRDGIPVSIATNVSLPYPGRPRSDSDPSGTRVESQSDGGDVLICRRPLTDQIIGPVPAQPRQPTGDSAFDNVFDVFSNDTEFRALSYPSARARMALLQIGLQWLRRKDGKLELFLDDIAPNQMESVVSTTVELARTHATADMHYRDAPGAQDAIPVPRGAVDRPGPRLISWPVGILTFVALPFGVMGAVLLPLVPAVHNAFASIACDDPNAKVIGSSSQFNADTYYGVSCVRDGAPAAPISDMLNYACAGLGAGVPLAIGLLFTLWAVIRLLRSVAQSQDRGP
jgi:hypothetical protein